MATNVMLSTRFSSSCFNFSSNEKFPIFVHILKNCNCKIEKIEKIIGGGL